MSRKSPGTRRLIVALASLSLLGQAIQLPTPLTAANAAERKVTASAGQGPEQRPLPRSAQARHGLGKGQRPPVEPPATDAAGPARRLSRAAWRRVATSAGVSSGVASARNAVLPASVVGLLRAEEDEPTPTGEPTASPTEEPAATATPTGESTASPTEEPTVTASPTAEPTPSETTPPVGDPELAARNLLVRPGYLLGDTSLVLYFDAGAGGTDRWASWQATVYDAESGTAQLSRSLSRNDLARCGVQREFCRAFGVADGWTLVEGHTYFATVTATLDDGALVTSEPSNTDRPRVVAAPPVFPPSQAARSARGNVFTQSAALHSIRGDGVDTATGSYTLVRPDLQLASYGVPFALVRTYSTQNTAAGRLGLGWASLLDVQVVPPAPGATAVTVRAEDGAEAVYPRDDDGAYRRPAGVRSTLRALTGGGWSLTRPDRSRYTFDADGRLVSVVNARGDGLRIRHAATTWTVTDAAGHEVTVTLRQDGLVEKVTLPDGRYVQYGYSNGQLSQVIDVMGSNWTYRYDGARLLNEVVDPRGISTTRTEYGADGRVSRQTDAEGAVTTFDWDAATQEATTRDADGVVTHDGYRDGVQLYTQNGNGDVNTQRYDEALNQSLLVDGLANQYERVYDTAGNLTAVLPPAPFDEQETRDYDGTLLTTVTDARGGITRYRHTAYGELAEVVEPGGARSSYDYDDRGLLVAETDQRGSVTRYTYDEAGNQTSRTTPDGAVTRYGHDEVGRQTSVVDPRGNVEGANPADHTTRFEYDKADRRIATRLPGVDKPSRTVYDAAGQVMTVVDVHGQETKYTYTRVARRIQSVTDRTGRRTEYAYTAAGRQSAVTDPAGGRTTYTYNDRGDLATTTSPLGNVSGADPAPYTTTNVYDANGFLVRTSIPYPGGGTASTDTTYDALRRPTSTTDPLGATTALRYDSTDNPVSAVFPSGATASVSYDADGRPEVATSPSGQVYSAEYDDAGNLVRQVSASGGVTTWTYDRMNRVSTMVEPRGNVEGADPADYTTRYRYDVAGNLVEVTDPLGHATSYRYDALDRLTAVTDADDRSVRYRYDALGRLTTVAGPDAPSLTEGVTGYDYDPEGRLLRRLDANGHDTKYAYDSAGRLTQVVPPLGFARDYRYDVASNVTAVVTSGSGDPAARTVTNTYDSLDRLVARQVGPDGPRYAFGYDAAGRLTSLADPTGTETRSYDVEGALTEVTRGDRSFGYAYDDGGNITRRTYPDGTTITSDYDRGGRLSSLDVTGGSAGSESAGYAFDYDPAGRLTTTTLPKGTGMEIRRGYDRAGRLTLLDTRDAAGDPVARYAFDLDTVGNPTQVTTTRGERSELTSYTYDAAYRLAGACYGGTGCDTATGSVAYTYDRVGNRLTETRAGTLGTSRSSYRYDNADQLTEVATTTAAGQETTSYRYDPEGNLISAGKDTFTYNLDHTMASATVGGVTTRYAHDAQGLRLSATTGGDEASTRTWEWDVNGSLPHLAVESATGGGTTDTRAFLPGYGTTSLGVLDGGVSSLVPDPVAGVAALVDGDGRVQAEYDYDPFGLPREGGTADATAGSGDGSPLGFAGMHQDPTLGDRYATPARAYDPATGRFLQQDPLSQGQRVPSVNGYSWVGGLATTMTDPSGLAPQSLTPGNGSSTPKHDTAMHNAAITLAMRQLYLRYGPTNVYGAVRGYTNWIGYDFFIDIGTAPGVLASSPKSPKSSRPDILVRSGPLTYLYDAKPWTDYGWGAKSNQQLDRYIQSMTFQGGFGIVVRGPSLYPDSTPYRGGTLNIFSDWRGKAPSGHPTLTSWISLLTNTGIIFYEWHRPKPKKKKQPATATAPQPDGAASPITPVTETADGVPAGVLTADPVTQLSPDAQQGWDELNAAFDELSAQDARNRELQKLGVVLVITGATMGIGAELGAAATAAKTAGQEVISWLTGLGGLVFG